MFTPEEHRTIVQCLRAAADGPFFPEWEFPTLFGFSRNEFRNHASRYEPADDLPVHVGVAVHNTLNNLIGYPIDAEDQWAQWIPVPRSTLQTLFDKWRAHYEYS